MTEEEVGQLNYEKQINIYKKINDYIKELPLNPLDKISIIESMKDTFNNPMNKEITQPFLNKVDKSLGLINQISVIFTSHDADSELIGDTFTQVNGELCEYYQ